MRRRIARRWALPRAGLNFAEEGCQLVSRRGVFGATRIDIDPRRLVVQDHVLLADGTAVPDGKNRPFQPELLLDPPVRSGLRDEGDAPSGEQPAVGTEHGPHDDRAGVGIDAPGSPIFAAAMMPPLRMVSGLTPNRAGFQTTRSANFPASIEPT